MSSSSVGTVIALSRRDGRITVVGRQDTHDTGLGCVASKRGSESNGLQSEIRPSARPTARIAWPPSVEEKSRDVTC
jgi:hypothetical protein